jgi:uncharacterized membrane protein SirB2
MPISWKFLHILLAFSSVLIFTLRGGAAVAGAGWPQQSGVRLLSMLIDSALLAIGLWLAWRMQALPEWLIVKLILLLAYIGLGVVVMRRGVGWLGRAAAYVGALACVLLLVGVARAHHPLGWWA